MFRYRVNRTVIFALAFLLASVSVSLAQPTNPSTTVPCTGVSTVQVTGSPFSVTAGASVILRGCNFGASTGTLSLCNSMTFAGSSTCVTQSTSAWAATSITVSSVTLGALGATGYWYVQTSGGQINPVGTFAVSLVAGGASCTVTSDGSDSDTQTKITAASDGDVVCIHSGSWTWTSAVTWTAKRLTIRGESDCTLDSNGWPTSCPTVITLNMGYSASAFLVETCLAADFVNIGHLELVMTAVDGDSGVFNIGCTAANGYPEVGFRVHHIRMTGNPSEPRYATFGAVYGLYDHNYHSSTTRGNISMTRDNAISTANTYHEAFSFGDQNALYIEHNYFYSFTGNQGNGTSDNYSGARYVFRFNTVFNNNVGHHGFDSQPRGVPTFEVYGNTFIAEGSGTSMVLTQPRSGTGQVWGNVVKNVSGASNAYTEFLQPIYYGGMSSAESISIGGLWYQQRVSPIYYPTGTWGPPYTGTSSFVTAPTYVGLSVVNSFDGNQYALGSFDSDAAYSRTVTDAATTDNNKVVTSAAADFVSGDLLKHIVIPNFVMGRLISGCVFQDSTTTVNCSGGDFTVKGDTDRDISRDDRGCFGNGSTRKATIATVNSSTQIVVSGIPIDCSSPFVEANATDTLALADPFIKTVDAENQITMNVRATANASSQTLTVGFSNQGYPLLDQPGRGYFNSNGGGWPNGTPGAAYSDANYERLMPIYAAGNSWMTTNSSYVFQSCTSSPICNPPATAANFVSTAGYLKPNREWFDPAGGAQTAKGVPFDGSVGSGFGTLAQRPDNCTVVTTAGGGVAGVGYLAYDQGSWNTSGETLTYDEVTFSQGVWYTCTATDTWSPYMTPLTYPHPLAN